MSASVPDRVVEPGQFDATAHYYPRVPNAVLHPMVGAFLRLGNTRIAERYAHLHPEVDRAAIHALLARTSQWLTWAGADLFHVTNERGVRRMVVIETNSSPSGQKSMPLVDEGREQAGYRRLLEGAFLPRVRKAKKRDGVAAVLWDKNPMEVTGYAATLADLLDEPVHLVHVGPEGGRLRVDDQQIAIEVDGVWTPVRAAVRYVTQRPWAHLPATPRATMLNPVLACLAGGRNKTLAAKAYDLFNARMQETGLRIRFPETVGPVSIAEVPLLIERMGGVAAVKVPYANAGQGVWTITSKAELQAFLDTDHRYERFVVQALIGNVGWSSRSHEGRLFHVGTVPDKHQRMYVADLRMMVGNGPDGFFPVAMYARRAEEPLTYERPAPGQTWSMLGTNLSRLTPHGEWTTEPDRLLLMDSRDFNRLGVGLDDLIEAYLQTVMSTLAIDDLAGSLVTQRGRFRKRFFAQLNPDPALVSEILG